MARSKTERLMALIALLLKRKRPVSKDEIRCSIPDYVRATVQTFDRIFERDKKELRGMGIDIRAMTVATGWEITGSKEATRYRAQEIGYTIAPGAILSAADRFRAGRMGPALYSAIAVHF